MNLRSKRFVCDSCGAREFEVVVEPTYDVLELERTFPDAVAWAADIHFCPSCGEELPDA